MKTQASAEVLEAIGSTIAQDPSIRKAFQLEGPAKQPTHPEYDMGSVLITDQEGRKFACVIMVREVNG